MLSESVAPHFIGFSCRFTPREDRDRLGFEYVEELRTAVEEALREEPGAVAFFTPEVGGSTSDDPIQIDLVGEDLSHLREIAERVERTLRNIPGATDVRNNLGQKRTQASFEPKRTVLAVHDVDEVEMGEQARLYAGFHKCGKFRRNGADDDYDVYLGCYWPGRSRQFRGPATWEQFRTLSVIDRRGESVPACVLGRRYLYRGRPIDCTQGWPSVRDGKGKDGRDDRRRGLGGIDAGTGEDAPGVAAGLRVCRRGRGRTSGRNVWLRRSGFRRGGFSRFRDSHAVLQLLTQPAIILASVAFGLIGVFWGFFFSRCRFRLPPRLES